MGSSRCKMCSNNLSLLAATPIWLLLGIILIIFLMYFNLTISAGTINGLIFYANIIHAQHSTLFIATSSNSFLSKFISWLNLDQGIELCLYDGLDTYTITWLQFLFPLYIWSIKAKHNYWTGLLLIFRIVLLIIFLLNQTNNPTTNLVSITAASITLLIWLVLLQ